MMQSSVELLAVFDPNSSSDGRITLRAMISRSACTERFKKKKVGDIVILNYETPASDE